MSVHLKGGCRSDPLRSTRFGCDDLARQADILAGWIADRARANDAFIILGDFNRQMAVGEEFFVRLGRAVPLTLATAGVTNPAGAVTGPSSTTSCLAVRRAHACAREACVCWCSARTMNGCGSGSATIAPSASG